MVTMGKLPQTPRAKKVIEYSIEEARNLNHNYVGTEHLLLGLLREQEGVAAQVLMNLGLKLEDVRQELLNLLGRSPTTEHGSRPRESLASPFPRGTPSLDQVSQDWTELARQGKLDPVIGRAQEVHRLIRTLCRLTKNCPVLLGEAGVGKTAIVRGLAHLLASGQVPELLRGFRVVAVDLALLLAGGPFGELKDRLGRIVQESQRSGNTLLFFDDLHLWVTTPYVLSGLTMQRGRLQHCITATTLQEHANLVQRASTLARFFVPIRVSPLSATDSLEVLRGLRERHEAHHGVVIQDEALQAAIDLALRDAGVGLLDRALDLIDEAAAEVRLRISSSSPPELEGLDTQIARLNQEKESAVAEQDFERAVHFRDAVDAIKKQKEEVLRAWRERPQGASAEVNEEIVREIAGEGR
jgi:ATP-dependent Clp protease ATP-binding subunit ClpC